MKKVILLTLVAAAIVAFFALDLGSHLTLENFQSQREQLESRRDASPVAFSAVFFVAYTLMAALSIPGAAIMTLVAGALFGLIWGLVLVSFASSIGALLAFLLARALLHDWVQARFGKSLRRINAGVAKDGAFYLFSLRLVPIFPFFVINLVMGLTPMGAWTFYWVSQVGMLAGTAVYVNAGTQLGQAAETGAIMTPGLLLSFLLLAAFPWLAKVLFAMLERHRKLRNFSRPKNFDNNLIVIGAGSGGLVASLIAATVKARVTLIERHKMGGDCLNTGCVPSKAIIRSSRIAHYIQRAAEYGIRDASGEVDFGAVMSRVHRTIAAIEPHDSVARYSAMGVNCISGDARIVSPWEVEVDGRRISGRNIVIATGGRPAVPPIEGIEDVDYLTSDTLWDITTLPRRLLVIGGGPIGCELAQAFRRLGSEVTMVVRSKLLPKEDDDVADAVAARFRGDGIRVLTQTRCERFVQTTDTRYLVVLDDSGSAQVAFDQVLVATGRRANVEQLGIDRVGIGLTEKGTIAVDEYLRTDCPTIYACGDVIGPYQFTHVSSHQAWYAAVNSLFGMLRRFRADYSVIPWVTFTDPEVARVGLSEREARAREVDYEVTRYGIDDLDRAIADSEAHGFVKVLTRPGKDKILGVTIVGYHASELIAEYILAMRHGLGLNKIMATIHIYPTLNEANKYAAGEWKKAHKPEWLLPWVEKLHAWRR